MNIPSFTKAKENGETINKSGYHKPGSQGMHMPNCGCKKTTEKGAYRDETVRMDDYTIHFYHQSPVVVEQGNFYRLDSCGWQTSTTKERINRYLPPGIRVYQEDFDWFVKIDGQVSDFEDGMWIEG